jgi:hypothetical protein
MRSRPPRRSPDTTPHRLSAVLRDNVKVFVASREVKGAELTPHLPAPGGHRLPTGEGWSSFPGGPTDATEAVAFQGSLDNRELCAVRQPDACKLHIQKPPTAPS